MEGQGVSDNLELYRTLVETAPLLIIVFDLKEQKIVFINEMGRRLIGADNAESLLGRSLWSFIPKEEQVFIRKRLEQLSPKRNNNPPVETQIIREDGSVIDVESRNSLIRYRNRAAVLAVIQDITERKSSERLTQQMAYTDTLTNLPNRRALVERIERSLSRTEKAGNGIALMFLDLDRFKVINDSFGHDFGDELLRQVAERLRLIIPANTLVARLGGDEFTVLSPCDENCLLNLPSKIVRGLNAEPFHVYGHEVMVSTSLGATCQIGHSHSGAELLRQADAAMYQAKEHGGNTFSWYQSRTTSLTPKRRLALERGMHQALERDELSLVYQPVVEIGSGHLASVEALIRWKSSEFGEVPPGECIPLAEENGFILELGEWVLRRVCQDIIRWQEAGFDCAPVAVNVSPRQFRSRSFCDTVAGILHEYNLPGKSLELEVTERVLMENGQWMIARLQELRQLGIQVSIDDFGTGYSSLAYLKQFPTQTLKIDRSFINDLMGNDNSSQMVSAMIQLAHSLGMKVTAEGVEVSSQREFLLNHHCDYVQGYLISRPQTAECFDFTQF